MTRGQTSTGSAVGCGRFLLAAALAVITAWPCIGYAESSGAVELFRQGVRALRARRYDDAANFFRLSYQMEPRASTMCNLALTHERAGNIQQARDSYRQCAADDREGRYRDHALEQVAAMDRQLASSRRQPRPPTTVQQPGPQYEVVQPRRSHTLAWIGIPVELLGLGALGAAIGLNVWSNRVYDELNEQYGNDIPQGSAAAARVDRGRAGTQAALGLYISGGVLSALGAILIVLDLAGIQIGGGGGYALSPSSNGLALSFSFSAL